MYSADTNDPLESQVVKHVHFHVIPKPSEGDTEGLVIGWPQQKVEMSDLAKELEVLKNKL